MSRPYTHTLAVTLSTLIFAAAFAAMAPIASAQIGLDFLNLPADAKIGAILSRLYVFGVSMTAIAALIMFTIGGVQYMIAGDRDPGPAKERMRNALFGLILALTSYLILYTINPDLVREVKLNPILIDLQQAAVEGARENEQCIGESSNVAEQCAAGQCYTNETKCVTAKTRERGVCFSKCTPSKGVEHNKECFPTNTCKESADKCRWKDGSTCKEGIDPKQGYGFCWLSDCK